MTTSPKRKRDLVCEIRRASQAMSFGTQTYWRNMIRSCSHMSNGQTSPTPRPVLHPRQLHDQQEQRRRSTESHSSSAATKASPGLRMQFFTFVLSSGSCAHPLPFHSKWTSTCFWKSKIHQTTSRCSPSQVASRSSEAAYLSSSGL